MSSDEFATLVEQLKIRGWAVSDHLIPSHLPQQLLDSLLLHKSEGRMRPAQIGRSTERQRADEIRGDSINWILPAQANSIETDFLTWAEQLMVELGRALLLPMDFFECHYACYPAGARYRIHKDQFQGSDERRISFVLYLNRDWSEDCGGQLRIYRESSKTEVDSNILPVLGRIALFLSQSIYHEVLPARQERLSVTGWMKLNDIQKNPLSLIS